MKATITIALIVLSNLLLGQTGTPVKQEREIVVVDSQYVEIKSFKDQFNHIDNNKWFYTYMDTIIDSVGNKWIGNKINDPFMEFNDRKIGIWTQYYPNDSVKSIGEFSLGATTYCQFAGPIISGYNFKSGKWLFFYPNGQLKAEGHYTLKVEEFGNNCGDDGWYRSTMNDNNWNFYNESGERIESLESAIELDGI